MRNATLRNEDQRFASWMILLTSRLTFRDTYVSIATTSRDAGWLLDLAADQAITR